MKTKNKNYLPLLLFISVSTLLIVEAEVVKWRYPGLSGRGLDPYNWMGQTSGQPHVPGPNDDVVLGGAETFTYGAQILVPLEVSVFFLFRFRIIFFVIFFLILGSHFYFFVLE